MPYVSRDENNAIIELHNSPPEPDSQWLEINSPEILDFLAKIKTSQQARSTLSATDKEMVRVIEDVIDLLVAKQLCLFTDLPEAVQAKLGARKQIRQDMQTLDNLIGDDEDIF